MANDRITLICKKCKESIVLYKYYPSGGYSRMTQDSLNQFLGVHVHECQGKHGDDLGGDPGFELDTESGYYMRKVKGGHVG